MSKRDIRRWAYWQYLGDIQAWQLWLRWVLAIGAVLLALKLRGIL